MINLALAIHIGPLGSFISAGRRSRDLWWGSTWLAECTASVASRFYELGQERDENGKLVYEVTLVLPSHERLETLDARTHRRGGANRDFQKRVSNHIGATLATTRPRSSICTLLAHLEAYAHEWVRTQTRDTMSRSKDRVGRQIDLVLDHKRFEEQLEAIANGDFVHFTAAWAPIVSDGVDPVGAALHRADQLAIAARRTRTFPRPTSTAGTRKSDLDAGRDGVLVEPSTLASQKRAKARLARAVLGIGESEQLDALGFARRIASFDSQFAPKLGRLPFPPISRIAIDPWITRPKVGSEAARLLAELKTILIDALDARGATEEKRNAFLTWCTPACDPHDRPADKLSDQLFPFDASILFEGGLAAASERVKLLDRDCPEQGLALKTLNRIDRADVIPKLHKLLGLPSPYYALIEADGDGVGTELTKADSKRYSELVSLLDEYADRLDDRIRPLGARAFYVGGDDALVLAPLAKLTEVLTTMTKHFTDSMKNPDFTITCGVIVAHIKDDLRWVRRQASEAIHSAKRRRAEQKQRYAASNPGSKWTPVGWAEIREQPRSGSMRRCTGEVTTLTQNLDAFVKDIELGNLSQRSPQLMLELGSLVDFGSQAMTPPNEEENQKRTLLRRAAVELAAHRVRAQMQRSSDQSNPTTTVTATTASGAVEALRHATSWNAVEDLASRLRLAARLAEAQGIR